MVQSTNISYQWICVALFWCCRFQEKIVAQIPTGVHWVGTQLHLMQEWWWNVTVLKLVLSCVQSYIVDSKVGFRVILWSYATFKVLKFGKYNCGAKILLTEEDNYPSQTENGNHRVNELSSVPMTPIYSIKATFFKSITIVKFAII